MKRMLFLFFGMMILSVAACVPPENEPPSPRYEQHVPSRTEIPPGTTSVFVPPGTTSPPAMPLRRPDPPGVTSVSY